MAIVLVLVHGNTDKGAGSLLEWDAEWSSPPHISDHRTNSDLVSMKLHSMQSAGSGEQLSGQFD